MTIHDEALNLVCNYKKTESALIGIIQKIDDLKAFREKGFSSCYDYCVRFLKLSESTSYDFINVARKSKSIPQLKQAIEDNLITVSKARRIVPVITQENSSHWIKLAQDLPKEKLQKHIVAAKPELAVTEKVKYVTEKRLKIELGVSEEFIQMLKRAQDILSQKTKSHENYEATLGEVLKEFLDRNDPLKKAERTLAKQAPKLGPGQVQSSIKTQIPFERSPLDAAIKHQVNLRDQSQCAFVHEGGKRCVQRRWLQIHHKIPINHGGQNQLQNLETLCFHHHKIMHSS